MSDKTGFPTMPVLPLPGEEILKLNLPYAVMSVEPFKSEVNGYFGFRVVLDGGKDNVLSLALWYGETVGRKSKMGSFMVALGQDVLTWPLKIIKVISWNAKNRIVELVPTITESTEKTPETTAKKK